jgi:quaternary ammonium compound-resistance protein SugE
MAWIYLLLASFCEIVWATGMKYTGGFSSRPWLSLGTFVVSIASFLLLALAMRALPMGTSYAIWTGLGAVGTAAVGIAFFNEPAALMRLLCIALIVAGIIGLKLTAGR